MSAWDYWLDDAMKKMAHGVADHIGNVGPRNDRALVALKLIFTGVQTSGAGTIDEAIEAFGLPQRLNVHPDEFVTGMLHLIGEHQKQRRAA